MFAEASFVQTLCIRICSQMQSLSKCRYSTDFITDKGAHWKCPLLSWYSEFTRTTNKLASLHGHNIAESLWRQQLLKLVCSSRALLSFLCCVSPHSCGLMQAEQGKNFTECSILRLNDFFPRCPEIIVISIYLSKYLKATIIYQGPLVTCKYTHFLYNRRKLASHASEW